MRRSRRKSAFTLIELIVMGLIGLLVSGMVWYMVVSFTKQSEHLDTRLRALQASQFVFDRIRQDLKGYYHREGYSVVVDFPPRLSFSVFKDYTYDVNRGVQASIHLEPIDYEFDTQTRYLSRNGEPLKFSRFEAVKFEHLEAPKTTPGRLLPIVSNSIKVTLTYVPEEKLGTPLAEGHRITHEAVMSLPQVSLEEAYSFSPPGPFDVPFQ